MRWSKPKFLCFFVHQSRKFFYASDLRVLLSKQLHRFREHSKSPYSKSFTVISSSLWSPSLEPPVPAALPDAFVFWFKLSTFSITTRPVSIFVVDAILHFSFSFFPYKTFPTCSINYNCMPWVYDWHIFCFRACTFYCTIYFTPLYFFFNIVICKYSKIWSY